MLVSAREMYPNDGEGPKMVVHMARVLQQCHSNTFITTLCCLSIMNRSFYPTTRS